jgi:hypothetical protein
MNKTENDSTQQRKGVVFELRTLPNRWVEPMGREVLSSHNSAHAAQAAYERRDRSADNGTGRSTSGNYVPNIVVRVNGDGTESVAVPRDRMTDQREKS